MTSSITSNSILILSMFLKSEDFRNLLSNLPCISLRNSASISLSTFCCRPIINPLKLTSPKKGKNKSIFLKRILHSSLLLIQSPLNEKDSALLIRFKLTLIQSLLCILWIVNLMIYLTISVISTLNPPVIILIIIIIFTH